MTEATDFIALYSELRITPECTAEEFKRAYRRRVSELHPDRIGGGEDALKALNLGYAAAQEFHRTHGRFPGAAAPRSIATGDVRTTGRITALPEHPPAGANDDEHPHHSRWLSLVLLVLLAIFAFAQFTRSQEQAVATDAAAPNDPAATTRVRPPSLLVGMTQRDVVDHIGRPLEISVDGMQWLYGPSWIRLACGKVVDWYSSPLKPLGSSNTKPGPADVVAGHDPSEQCIPDPLRVRAMPPAAKG